MQLMWYHICLESLILVALNVCTIVLHIALPFTLYKMAKLGKGMGT